MTPTDVVFAIPTSPDGLCRRLDEDHCPDAPWDALHQGTAALSPFNFAVHARLVRGGRTIGYGSRGRFHIDAEGALTTHPLDRAGRDRFLVEQLHVDPRLVRALPADAAVPAR